MQLKPIFLERCCNISHIFPYNNYLLMDRACITLVTAKDSYFNTISTNISDARNYIFENVGLGTYFHVNPPHFLNIFTHKIKL